ncbi:MAG: hypothetical protein IJG05_02075 [Solobacterium sp.]|nr:hypothetical protein [Solobacterium sp.]
MNRWITAGIILGGGTIAFDHLVYTLPHPAAVVLFTAAVIMMITGMIMEKKASSMHE